MVRSRGIMLIGGGGHARSVLGAMQRAGLEVSGIVERDSSLVGTKVLGVPVVGTDADLTALAAKGAEAIVTVGKVGNEKARAALCKRCRDEGFVMATFVAISAIISSEVSIGSGTVVLEGAVLNARSNTGEDCIINTGAIVEHDVNIGDRVHVATGARVCGGVSIGDDTFIGAGATVIQGIRIGDNSVVAAGSVVTRDVPEDTTVRGNPARKAS